LGILDLRRVQSAFIQTLYEGHITLLATETKSKVLKMLLIATVEDIYALALAIIRLSYSGGFTLKEGLTQGRTSNQFQFI